MTIVTAANAAKRYDRFNARPLIASLAFAWAIGSAPVVLAANGKLNIGDPAPMLQPAKWLKGEPITKFQYGHVYIIEFWATWCGPCKQAMPHLSELARKYQGQADMIGVDIWESPDPTVKTLPKVEAFVKSQGTRMDYHIAADATDNRIANAYMQAADMGGIPTAFIVGKDGRIAWIGNPLVGLDDVLPRVIDGTFDVAGARAARDRSMGPMAGIQAALTTKDYAKAIQLMDAEIARDPKSAPAFSVLRFGALAHIDLGEFEKQARKRLAEVAGTEAETGQYNMLCSIFASDPSLAPDAYHFGRGLVDEALKLKANDRVYLFLAMGAQIDAFLGDKTAALRTQTNAIKEAETDPHCPPEFLQFLRNKLEIYRTDAGK